MEQLYKRKQRHWTKCYHSTLRTLFDLAEYGRCKIKWMTLYVYMSKFLFLLLLILCQKVPYLSIFWVLLKGRGWIQGLDPSKLLGHEVAENQGNKERLVKILAHHKQRWLSVIMMRWPRDDLREGTRGMQPHRILSKNEKTKYGPWPQGIIHHLIIPPLWPKSDHFL